MALNIVHHNEFRVILGWLFDTRGLITKDLWVVNIKDAWV